MSVSTTDLLQYAEAVFANSSCESGYRNSVGRAYYAAMHHCRDFQTSLLGGSSSTKGKLRSHARLINSFLSPITKDFADQERSMRIGLELHALKALRNVADYDVGRIVTREDAEDVVERAKIIFEDI